MSAAVIKAANLTQSQSQNGIKTVTGVADISATFNSGVESLDLSDYLSEVHSITINTLNDTKIVYVFYPSLAQTNWGAGIVTLNAAAIADGTLVAASTDLSAYDITFTATGLSAG